MGIFSNFALNRYRNYVQNSYFMPRLELIVQVMTTPAEDQIDATFVGGSIYKFYKFAIAMDKLIFSDTGVFKNDIWKLDADKLLKLYEIFIVYASWEEKNPFMGDKAETLNNVFGFEIEATNLLYKGLNASSSNPNIPSTSYALYRWSTTVLGHEDEFERSLFDKSPDCKSFEEAMKVAKAHADITH